MAAASCFARDGDEPAGTATPAAAPVSTQSLPSAGPAEQAGQAGRGKPPDPAQGCLQGKQMIMKGAASVVEKF